MTASEDTHWYSKVCLSGAEDLEARIDACQRGEFVWVKTRDSDLYGETFMGPKASADIIEKNNLPLKLEIFDTTRLAQDAFVLRLV